MKKVSIIILILVLLFSLWFFWKGGHHAIALAEIVTDWLDTDSADQFLTIELDHKLSLTADTFWTQYADETIFGISAQGVTAYTDGKNLYMDTGKAYALPEISGLREYARKLALGMLLSGRITKTGDTYHVTMDRDELKLNAALTAAPSVQRATITAVLPGETTINLSMSTTPALPHPIPRQVSDAIVQARMEPPMPLTEPLAILLPALEALLPLEGDLTLGVECGILELKETVRFRMDHAAAEVERKGTVFSIDLPGDSSNTDPTLLGLLLLRNGNFTQEGDSAEFEVLLTPDTTTAILESLVPQSAGLGIAMESSTLCIQIREGRVTNAMICADGSVPFLITTIPVTFSADLTIH